MRITNLISGAVCAALSVLSANSSAQYAPGPANLGQDSTDLASIAWQYNQVMPTASTNHAQTQTIKIRALAGQYVLRRYKSNGALVPANQVQCQPNPFTGSCSCPAGTNDYPYMVGQSYLYKDWDTYFELHICYTT